MPLGEAAETLPSPSDSRPGVPRQGGDGAGRPAQWLSARMNVKSGLARRVLKAWGRFAGSEARVGLGGHGFWVRPGKERAANILPFAS
jgi:hypothetical protein